MHIFQNVNNSCARSRGGGRISIRFWISLGTWEKFQRLALPHFVAVHELKTVFIGNFAVQFLYRPSNNNCLFRAAILNYLEFLVSACNCIDLFVSRIYNYSEHMSAEHSYSFWNLQPTCTQASRVKSFSQHFRNDLQPPSWISVQWRIWGGGALGHGPGGPIDNIFLP